MDFSLLSDRGKKREINEDSMATLEGDNFKLFIIADGVGGYSAGEVASKMAVDIIAGYIKKNNSALDDKTYLVKEAIRLANLEIFKESIENSDRKNMGTTCDCLYIYENKAIIGHVGDSRVYKFKDMQLSQVTKDHSLINELIDSGEMTEEEAKSSTKKNIITRALGGSKNIMIDIHELETSQVDIFMLCTDGLTDMIDENQIANILKENISVNNKAELLVSKANENGGRDNISVILVEMR